MFLKKSLISTAFVFLSVGAIAEEISNDTIYLKWGGVAPKSSYADGGFCIDGGENAVDQAAGELTFIRNTEDNTKVDITASTKFYIRVYAYDSNDNSCITYNDQRIPFKYTITSFDVEITDENGVPQEVDNVGWALNYYHADNGINSGTGASVSGSLSVGKYDGSFELNGDKAELYLDVTGKKLDVGSGVWAQARAYVLIEPVQA